VELRSWVWRRTYRVCDCSFVRTMVACDPGVSRCDVSVFAVCEGSSSVAPPKSSNVVSCRVVSSRLVSYQEPATRACVVKSYRCRRCCRRRRCRCRARKIESSKKSQNPVAETQKCFCKKEKCTNAMHVRKRKTRICLTLAGNSKSRSFVVGRVACWLSSGKPRNRNRR
jgi:hypothetical protein